MVDYLQNFNLKYDDHLYYSNNFKKKQTRISKQVSHANEKKKKYGNLILNNFTALYTKFNVKQKYMDLDIFNLLYILPGVYHLICGFPVIGYFFFQTNLILCFTYMFPESLN